MSEQDSARILELDAGENRLQRIELTGEPGASGLGEPETLLDGIPAGSLHNGGRIAFGPDEMLYMTVGDTGNAADAQDRDRRPPLRNFQ